MLDPSHFSYMSQERIQEFFAFARERHMVYLRRRAGSAPPFSKDPIFNRARFTNVYRELDRTTAWFRENVRKVYDNTPEVMLATVFFRGFNRIETGKILFASPTSIGHRWVKNEASDSELVAELVDIQESGAPVVTGAYTIMTPKGLTKAQGVAYYANFFRAQMWKPFTEDLARWGGSAPREATWKWLKDFPGQGSFISGQVIEDLRWTYLHNQAVDINSWAPLGPGSTRGLQIIAGRPINGRLVYDVPAEGFLINEMRYLLQLSRDPVYWRESKLAPPLEMHVIQNLLCEYSKVVRIRSGEGRTRSSYDGVARSVPGFDDYR